MSAVSSPKLTTAEELEQLSAQGGRYELVRGTLQPMSPTSEEHGNATFLLTLYLGLFIEEHRLGRGYAAETGFLIARDPDTVLAPDFAFVSRECHPETVAKTFAPFVPDLVLETRSVSDTKTQVARKIERWLQAGVKMILDLDPKAYSLTVNRPGIEPRTLGIEDKLFGEDVLPGFMLPLRKLFPSGAQESEQEAR
ncbi:MAG TPA: Uma2 family endonuclease [Chthonomonadaceae bacterium]|nr:Uma2 family endonuclease [Chthonomonadaceae bacterium]